MRSTESLINMHLAIWSETDREKRKQAIDEAYADTCEILDPFYPDVFRGRDALMRLIDDVQAKFPGFVFTKKRLDEHHNVIKLSWGYGTEENPDAVTGNDVFVTDGGYIRLLYIFIDKPQD